MNAFVLTTGRSGSTTFIQACRHIHNYSSGHETRIRLAGPDRLAYPDRHIEADNRLSWLLGRLERAYGDRARYVHLRRDPQATAASFARRSGFGIMKAYREGILARPRQGELALARDYIETVEANIEAFLAGKTHVLRFRLEQAVEDFERFWTWIGAQGDLPAALGEWKIRYNASR
jgi:hypothetical protein